MAWAASCSAPSKPVPGPSAPSVTSTAPAAAGAHPFDESILRGPEFLLELPSMNQPVLRDVVIGALEGNPEMVGTVTRFFQQAAQEGLDPQLLTDQGVPYLGAWAGRLRAEGLDPQVVRVGKALAGDGWNLPVRILGKKEFRGWVALDRGETTLLVSDVRLEEASPPASPFDPESPGQEISSPKRR